jgi:hypothetical protein
MTDIEEIAATVGQRVGIIAVRGMVEVQAGRSVRPFILALTPDEQFDLAAYALLQLMKVGVEAVNALTAPVDSEPVN